MKTIREDGTSLIKFYIGGKLLGQGWIKNFSRSVDRIALAKSLGINYYDRFIFPRREGTIDSAKVYIKGKPLNDFKNNGK